MFDALKGRMVEIPGDVLAEYHGTMEYVDLLEEQAAQNLKNANEARSRATKTFMEAVIKAMAENGTKPLNIDVVGAAKAAEDIPF